MGVTRHAIFLKLFLILSILIAACGEIDYTPHVTPLILGTLETPSIFHTPEVLSTEIPPKSLDRVTSNEAIDLCEEREYYGDETIGSCLAPGGDSYYVWISPEEVMELDRNNPFLQAFRFSALNRSDAWGKYEEGLGNWPDLIAFLGEAVALGPLCGGAIGTAMTGAGLIVTGPLGAGCVLDLFLFADTANDITKDAEDIVNSLINFYQYQIEAAYNFCRMEGKSDAKCK